MLERKDEGRRKVDGRRSLERKDEGHRQGDERRSLERKDKDEQLAAAVTSRGAGNEK